MKQIIYILFLSYALNASAQNLIPNAQFEQWINIGGWYDNPVDWQTSNNQIMAAQVTKDPNAFTGNFAMKLQTVTTNFLPFARCGFLLNDHPVYLQGYVAQSMANGDSASITALIYFQGNVIDSARYVIYSGINPNYTFFMMPVTSNMNVADSCEVIVNGCSIFNDAIFVDDLAMVFLVGENENQPLQIEIFPVPATNYLFVDSKQLSGCNFSLFDVTGKLVFVQQLVKGVSKLEMNVTDGNYIATISKENMMVYSQKILIRN